MLTARRAGVWAAVAAAAAGGCHAPRPGPGPAPPPPAAPAPPPPDLPAVAPGPLEPDLKSLPTVDPTAAGPGDVAPPPAGYRELTEEACRREAAARATVGVADPTEPGPEARPPSAAADALVREVRAHLAADARNRAAGQALDGFYQLADAEARGDLARASLPVLDRLREVVRKARADGLRVPADPDDLDRQRATVLGLVGQADLAARALDVDLKRRVGVPGSSADRLRPTALAGVPAAPVDVEAAVRVALETRPDLRALRAAYLLLTPETLPAVRQVVRRALGAAAGPEADRPEPPPGFLDRAVTSRVQARAARVEAAAAAELAARRQQLFNLVADGERQAADEVRAAAAAAAAQATQVGLARWRAEQAAGKVADAGKQGPVAGLLAELDALRARGEVTAAVAAWHRARARLLTAQGLLAGEPGPAGQR